MRDIVAIFIININTEISKTKILYCLFNVYISNTKKKGLKFVKTFNPCTRFSNYIIFIYYIEFQLKFIFSKY